MKKLFFTLLCSFSLFSSLQADHEQPFVAKDYSYLQQMPGFSKDALSLHFKLYQGYVTQTNHMLSLLQDMQNPEKRASIFYAEVKRRLMWEYDGMRLHEDYFDNLGGKDSKLDPQSMLYQELEQEFGSYRNWAEDFKATGAMRGIGWAILYRDPVSGRLVNTWINEHDTGHLAGGTPLLIMDVFEHAYLLDYGLDRKKYIEAFFNNINWSVVEARYTNPESPIKHETT
ncbi:MAG: superoxide dismutase [Verrucomicrobia bacterium]|nr:superoxide dismutase [Verrucomicrobiota bacterium]MBS0645157.1 superoxide dismutase [Verrucomicrobiota bacterium]